MIPDYGQRVQEKLRELFDDGVANESDFEDPNVKERLTKLAEEGDDMPASLFQYIYIFFDANSTPRNFARSFGAENTQ